MERRIPAGFHFVPTDEELITHFLNLKKPGEALSSCDPVIELDVYASEPWNIFNIQGYPWEIVNTFDKSEKKSAEYVIYVITPLKMIRKNRVSRTAGCGTWKGQTKCTKIKNQNNEVIGFKKMLVFEIKMNDTEIEYENNTHWIMHEYSRSEIVGAGDYVLCKIKRVELKKSEKKRKFEHISGGDLGEAQKLMRSQEEENPNHKTFDFIDAAALPMIHVPDHIPVPLPDDLDLGEDLDGFISDLNQQLQEASDSQPSSSDQPITTSNGSLYNLYYDTCCGDLGEAQKLMRSQEEENPNHKTFDAIDATALPMIHVSDHIPVPLPDDLNLGEDLDGFISDLNQQLQEASESQPPSFDQPKTTSNGSLYNLYYDTCGNLGEAHKFMKTQEEENPNQRSFDAIDATALPMIYVPDIQPLPDLFDLGDFDSDLQKNFNGYLSALGISEVDRETTSNGSLYDIVNFGIGNSVDPSTYLVDDDQQLQEANESQPSTSDQHKTT